MAISKQTWTGVAREATSGTLITPPTLYVPTKCTFKGTKKKEYLNEERGDRNENYGVVDSVRQTAIDLKGPWYNDAHAYFLIGAMGAVASSQPNVGTAPTVWKHNISLASIPPSLSLYRSFDAACYSSAYGCVEKFSLKFAAEGKLLECDTSLVGLWPSVVSVPPSPTYSTLLPFAGYAPTITLGGVASNDVNECNINYEQKVTLWYPSNGSPDFVTAYFGGRKLTFDFTARFDATTLYDKFRNSTQESLQIDFQGPIIASTFHQELNITINAVDYESMEHDTGKENVLLKVKGMALATSTQFFSAFVQNTISSYTV